MTSLLISVDTQLLEANIDFKDEHWESPLGIAPELTATDVVCVKTPDHRLRYCRTVVETHFFKKRAYFVDLVDRRVFMDDRKAQSQRRPPFLIRRVAEHSIATLTALLHANVSIAIRHYLDRFNDDIRDVRYVRK